MKRHEAQRPAKSDAELARTRWAASLKNWGHDPLRREDPEAEDLAAAADDDEGEEEAGGAER